MPTPPSIPEGSSDPGPGLEVALKELRSEYHQMNEMEMRIHTQRITFMRTIDKWLSNQERFTNEQMNMLQAHATQCDNDTECDDEEYQVELQESMSQPDGNALGGCKSISETSNPGVVSGGEATECITTCQETMARWIGPRPCPPPQLPDPDRDSHSEPSFPDAREFQVSAVITMLGKSCEDPTHGNAANEPGCRNSEECRIPELDQVALLEARELERRLSAEAEAYMPQAEKRLRQTRKSSRSKVSPGQPMCMARIVLNPLFDSTCAFMILFNSAIIGMSVEHLTSHTQETDFLIISGHTCSAFFFIELLLRMSSWGKQFFLGENRNWNIFDFILVALSAVDIMATTSLSTLKTLKMLRVIRVFRIFRFFRELSLLALMIMDSLISLGWALILLLLIIYVFSICFTAMATDKVRDLDANHAAAVQLHFGSLGSSIYSLVLSMLGGVSWGVCADALMSLGWLEGALFFFYVTFTILAVMNIITGVFVDNAVETARTQRDFLIHKEMELKEKYAVEMKALFSEMDKDGSGTISFQEVQQYLSDPRVQGYFAALGLDPNDTERLFKLIDNDGSGDVDVGEFLDGCLRLKGQARSIDVYAIMRTLKDLENRFDALMRRTKVAMLDVAT